MKLPDGVGVIGTTRRGDAGRQEPAQGHLERRAGREPRQRAARSKSSPRSAATRAARACRTRPSGDAKAAMQGAAKVFRGEYRTRYVYHAQMEPLNATASVEPRRQVGRDLGRHAGRRRPAQPGRAALLQTERSQASRCTSTVLGGGFGRRSQQEVVMDAVRLSKAVGKPVKLIWSREDDIALRQVPADDRAPHRGGLRCQRQARSPGTIAWSPSWSPPTRPPMAGGTPPPADRIVMKGSPIPQYPIPNKLAEHVVEPRPRPARALARRRQRPQRLRGRELPRRDRARTSARIRSRSGSSCRKAQPRMQTLLRTVAEMSDWTRKRDGTRARRRPPW